MRASLEWLTVAGSSFSATTGRLGHAQLSHYTAAYREWGEGPPLVLIPGLAGGLELLAPLARRLANGRRVIAYQLRGEDDCFALRRRFGLTDLVEDLAEFVEALGLERPDLFGVSFGGVLGLEFAARHPYRLRSLGVQGVGARFERSLLQRIAGLVLSGFPLPTDSAFVNQFFQLLFGRRQQPGPLFEFVTRQCWTTDQSVMAHRFRLVRRIDLRDRLGRVRVPTLVIGGERDVLVSPRSLDDLCAGVARSKRVVLPGIGHLAFVAHPERVAAEVNSFLGPLDD